MEFLEEILEIVLGTLGLFLIVIVILIILVLIIGPILYVITRKERKQLLEEISAAGGKLNHYLSKIESDSAQKITVKKSINYNEGEYGLPLTLVITENTNLLFLINWKSHPTPGIGEYPSSHRSILFSQIKGFEFLVDSNKVYGNKITSAVVGGLFFGVVGAITGAIITDSKVKHKHTIYLTTNSLENPSFEIVCKDRNTAIEILSTFEILEELNND